MLRRLLPFAVAALAAAPAALAGGPSPGVAQGGAGVVAPGGGLRYTAVGTARQTTVVAIRARSGVIVRSATIAGGFGIPAVDFNGSKGGLSADGSTLVLGDTAIRNGPYPLKKRSSFAVLSTKPLSLQARVTLKGDFSFDALSPDGSKLYLIQHMGGPNLNRYVVRAYDLDRQRLLPGRIADRTQRGWVMQGSPVTRATSAGGRWVYTLYMNPGGYPFVHALDTVRGVAHCIGIPWTGQQNALWKMRLALADGGRTLRLDRQSGRPYVAIATGTWRISHPATPSGGGGFPWWIVGVAGGVMLLAAAAALLLLRRRARRLGPLGWQRA
jgi:hypothetical protein